MPLVFRIPMFFVLLVTQTITAQINPAQQALNQVTKVLSGTAYFDTTQIHTLLQAQPWEALAYVHKGDSIISENLEEAVPDYYHFSNDSILHIKLVDQSNAPNFQNTITVKYKLNAQLEIELIKPNLAAPKIVWTIIYIDENYFALDFGDVRMFMNTTFEQ